MSNELLTLEQFTIELLKTLSEKSQQGKRISSEEKTILDISERNNSGNATKVEISVLNRIIKIKHKKYRTDFELKNLEKEAKDDIGSLLKKLRKSDLKSSAERRKARNHKLISYGGLIDIANLGFEDKGAILGALLYAKSALEHGKIEFERFKERGDELLAEREAQRLSKQR